VQRSQKNWLFKVERGPCNVLHKGGPRLEKKDGEPNTLMEEQKEITKLIDIGEEDWEKNQNLIRSGGQENLVCKKKKKTEVKAPEFTVFKIKPQKVNWVEGRTQ